MNRWKKRWKKLWYFIWEDNSIWSWIANIVIAFVLIKFIVYPGLGMLLQTSQPVVAVVSESMEHKSQQRCSGYGYVEFFNYNIKECVQYQNNMCGNSFEEEKFFPLDEYWKECGKWYETNMDINKNDFVQFPFKNGFNIGDIMILRGNKPENIKVGDIIVFWSNQTNTPIIHRVIKKWHENDGYNFQTKGDNNPISITGQYLDETKISERQIVGKAIFRIPLLGYIKIWAVSILNFFKNLILQKG